MDIVFARATVVAGHTTVIEGTHWPADDPIVRAYPSLFTDNPRAGLSYSVPPKAEPVEETAEQTAETPVEQATRAPGERRNVKRAN